MSSLAPIALEPLEIAAAAAAAAMASVIGAAGGRTVTGALRRVEVVALPEVLQGAAEPWLAIRYCLRAAGGGPALIVACRQQAASTLLGTPLEESSDWTPARQAACRTLLEDVATAAMEQLAPRGREALEDPEVHLNHLPLLTQWADRQVVRLVFALVGADGEDADVVVFVSPALLPSRRRPKAAASARPVVFPEWTPAQPVPVDHGDWAGRLAVPVSITLGQTPVERSSVQGLRVGQVLDLARPVDQGVSLEINGHPVARGTLAAIRGRLGIVITEMSVGGGAR